MTLQEKNKQVLSGQTTAVEWLAQALKKIEEQDGEHSVFLQINPLALEQAERVDKAVREGNLSSPVAGVPLAIKDNICIKNWKTTCGSRMMEEFVSPYSATVIERLEQAGAILIGKVNLDEFGMGNTGTASAFSSLENPWNPAYVCGGSSSGAAVSVAKGFVSAALGSDTGGSVRQPCGFCNLTGLKPTYGAVSRFGLVAYASSLEQIGPIAGNAGDCRALFSVICGQDERDMTSVPYQEDKTPITRIGVIEEFITPAYEPVLQQACSVFQELGISCQRISIPLLRESAAAYYVLACSQAASNLARFDGIRYGRRGTGDTLEEQYRSARTQGLGEEVKRRIWSGIYMLCADQYQSYYHKALCYQQELRTEIWNFLGNVDGFLCPTFPGETPRLGEMEGRLSYQGDLCTVFANLTGIPAVAFPGKWEEASGLPMGLQLAGRPFSEYRLLDVVQRFQEYTSFHLVRGEGKA